MSTVTWPKRLRLNYIGKEGRKNNKTIEVPGTPVHRELQRHVSAATAILKSGDKGYDGKPAYRNYLSARISFVVSDRAQKSGGTHGRTVIAFDFKIPKTELFNSTNLDPQLQDTFRETGYHTEQVLYTYLKSDIGQAYLLSQFKNAERQAVKDGKLHSITKQGRRKVYAMILDMHSSMNMCSLGTAHREMEKSCANATKAEQQPGKENLRAITARSFRNNGYIVSGYNRDTGAPKPDKVGLKMATRLSSEAIYYKDKVAASNPTELKEPAINRHANELVINKQVPEHRAPLDRQDYRDIADHSTILKSSSRTGLREAFNSYFAGITGGKRDIRNQNITAIRNMLLAFPHEMEKDGLIEDIIASDVLINALPNTICNTLKKLDSRELHNELLRAFIRNGNYGKAIECYSDGATLIEQDYSARNQDNVAFVCYPDIEGNTILWGLTESGSKETFDKIVKAAALTKEEVQAATFCNMEELTQRFETMEVAGRSK